MYALARHVSTILAITSNPLQHRQAAHRDRLLPMLIPLLLPLPLPLPLLLPLLLALPLPLPLTHSVPNAVWPTEA